MRPKKVILCVDDNELELSVLKFMLATNGYRILTAQSAADAITLRASTPTIDLVTVSGAIPKPGAAALVERLKRMNGSIPMIIFADPGSKGGNVADALICRRICPTVELLERIRIMSASKRGARKGAQRTPSGAMRAAAIPVGLAEAARIFSTAST